ncbi:SusE outer membrane protein [Sinomicrobium oceani]|uniref:SusE outer membrane protein n=1 Tax=Sinomicrobium oceani TaxID=1150368 RepID=A0A1K1R2W8_9FLAO|nr:SusE domain-containing protein [Sinomicrobium oceani]SFW66365.1 SusE outer membrane protein [Sinomicrobium oceani]
MKTIPFRYTLLVPLWGLVLGLGACDQGIQDIDKTEEFLELSVSSEAVALDADHLTADIVTFTWTEARSLEDDDYMVSYTTKLDVVGNNFGASTAIFNYEDEGIYQRSFTSEQLQNWANEKWSIPVNTPFTLEFRVIAQWEGGPAFEAPEVRTVKVDVEPVRTIVFDADTVFLSGTALGDTAPVEMSRTLENPNTFAYLLDLQGGTLQIPVAFEGETNYIAPADGDDTLHDGEAVDVKMRESPVSWKIDTPGEYRIVVDMQKAEVTIYSPEKALEPLSVDWTTDAGEAVTTTITDLWMHGAVNGWGTPIPCNVAVSLADPQVLVYTGGVTGKTKFIVYGGSDNNKNLAYAFSCPPKSETEGQEQSLIPDKAADLYGSASRGQRNSYYTIPSGTNMVVLDLRNKTIVAQKR